MTNLDIKGTVLGTSVYADGTLVAEDVTVTLPEVTPKTQTFNSMGEIELPLPLTEKLEATINKVGIDNGLINLLTPEKRTFEARWAQSIIKTDGTQKLEGAKAFITGIPKTIFPGGDIAPGENWEGGVPISVTRYQVYVNGKEKILVDKIKKQLRINGKDYAKSLTSLL